MQWCASLLGLKKARGVTLVFVLVVQNGLVLRHLPSAQIDSQTAVEALMQLYGWFGEGLGSLVETEGIEGDALARLAGGRCGSLLGGGGRRAFGRLVRLSVS